MNNNTEMTVSGPSFEELTLAEMHSIQGSGDVQAETTFVCAIAATVQVSSVVCASTSTGIATGATVVLTIKKC